MFLLSHARLLERRVGTEFRSLRVPNRTTLVTAPSIESPPASFAYVQGTHAIVNSGYSRQVRICVFA